MSDPGSYTIWSVLRRPTTALAAATPADRESLADAIDQLSASGVTVRGIYDVSGMRADADVMLWLHGPDPAGLQAAIRRLHRTEELAPLERTWGAMGVHRDAEFNRAHVPGFMRGIDAKGWVAVYPFDRSYDWYLLDPAERGRMLADHGRAGAAYKGVVANTVSAFALGDYEWILPIEADELTDLVDMMRTLRGVDARMHVREETPFYTGRRISLDELAEVLA